MLKFKSYLHGIYVAVSSVLLLIHNSSAASNDVNDTRTVPTPERICVACPYATIYARAIADADYASNLTAEVASEFRTMTGTEPFKVIIMVLDTTERHPFAEAICKEQGKKSSDNSNRKKLDDRRNSYEKENAKLLKIGVSLDDCLKMATMPVPYALVPFLAGQEANQVQDGTKTKSVVQSASGQQKTGHPLNGASLLCMPSQECNRHSGETVLPKMLRSQLGWFKYNLLVKPFGSRMRDDFAEILTAKSKTVIFDTWIDTSTEIAAGKKDALKKAYSAQVKQVGGKAMTNSQTE